MNFGRSTIGFGQHSKLKVNTPKSVSKSKFRTHDERSSVLYNFSNDWQIQNNK